MKKIFFNIIISLTLLFFGCDSKSDAEKLADEFCKCSRPLVESLEIYDEYNSENDLQKRIELGKEYEQLIIQANECNNKLNEITEKYSDKFDDELFNEEFEKALEEKCPDLMNTFNFDF